MKRHNNAVPAQILPPKIARRKPIPIIIKPTENDRFLRDIEPQELTDLLNTQTGLGLSQMPPTPPVNDNNPIH